MIKDLPDASESTPATEITRVNMLRLKKPWLAFLLSFLLPGAGLWYLGKWKWGFYNLDLVIAIAGVTTILWPDSPDSVDHAIAFGNGFLSGYMAREEARRINEGRPAENFWTLLRGLGNKNRVG